jgi:lipid-A-disaccharide synthase-like uncharacterized protein
MLVDLSQAVGGYLASVFLLNIDFWVVVGFIGQALFTARFIVQWVASEKAAKSVIPLAFWFFSIGGALLLLVYAIYRRDPVFIVGQGLGIFIYIRNLVLISREKRAKTGVKEG